MADLIIRNDTQERTKMFWRNTYEVKNQTTKIFVDPVYWCIYLIDSSMKDILESGAHVVMEKKGLFNGASSNNCILDVMYISKEFKAKLFWGTKDRFDFRDPITDLPIKVGAHGEAEVQVCNPTQFFLQLAGPDRSFNIEKLEEFVKAQISMHICDIIYKVMKYNRLSYCDIQEHILEISNMILPIMKDLFEESYGIRVYSFTLMKVFISDEDKQRLENAMNRAKQEEKDKRTAMEIASELERLKDKEWERTLILKELETRNHEKYLEVLAIISENELISSTKSNNIQENKKEVNENVHTTKNNKLNETSDVFCPECGFRNESKNKFCKKCGNRL